jgi:Protein of unknown function (DUF3455)
MAARLLTAILLTMYASGQNNMPPPVRETLKPPPNEKSRLQAHGIGVQIYVCKASAENAVWVLKGPDAKLLGNDHRAVGRHFAGPTWEWSDGSRIVGKVAATVESPHASAVPWLRLEVVRHEGQGNLENIASVQSLNTQGGKAPAAGCDQAHAGSETRVRYEADYLFYSAQ